MKQSPAIALSQSLTAEQKSQLRDLCEEAISEGAEREALEPIYAVFHHPRVHGEGLDLSKAKSVLQRVKDGTLKLTHGVGIDKGPSELRAESDKADYWKNS